jgi:tetratricopeptide (TPR) repeat protein
MHYSLKDYQEARRFFQRQLELDEDDPDVLYRIFLCHYAFGNQLKDEGQEELAMDEYAACLDPLLSLVEIDDTSVTYHRALMKVYNELGQLDEAAVELEKVRKLIEGGEE